MNNINENKLEFKLESYDKDTKSKRTFNINGINKLKKYYMNYGKMKIHVKYIIKMYYYLK